VPHPPPPGLRGVSCRRSVGPSGLRDSTPPSAASIVSSLAALLDPVGGDLLLPTRECVVLVLAAIASSEVVCRTADSWHRSPAPVVSHLCHQPHRVVAPPSLCACAVIIHLPHACVVVL
jgi:hypothetical protein